MSAAGGSEDEAGGEGAWNPGLASTIPRRLQSELTLFRPENAELDAEAAGELADLSGLPLVELAALRTERLAVHELLVRVTADYSVPDGPNYADLGISLRSMVEALHTRHVAPALEDIERAVEAERERAAAVIDEELARHGIGVPDVPSDVPAPPRSGGEGGGSGADDGSSRGWLARWLTRLGGGGTRGASGRGRAPPATSGPVEPTELVALARWRDALGRAAEPPAPLRRACLEALVRVVDAILAHRGRLLAGRSAVRRIALVLVMRERGAAIVAERLAPIVERGAAAEGFRPLPAQARPVIMNVKGASAAGKSTIRPRQRRLAQRLGIAWEDFALISPDYWRKYLLDYDSLGEDRRYGAMLCGQELELVDRKLDRYMADKAARGAMSHLLIDRFRFDSFTLEKDRTAESRLLTRFGHEIYLFFVITPPAETVERAWIRGRRTGRYKAVDDLLHHNIEAFDGMPALFLSWVTATDRRVHVEFLDNDVPEGTLPRTAAFAWNDAMTILDVPLMRAIDRYREIDVDASRPEDVLRPRAPGEEPAPAFVLRAAERVARIDFADRDTARVYARVERGRLRWTDEAAIAARADAADVRFVLDAIERASPARPPGGSGAGEANDASAAAADVTPPPPIDVARETRVTVGRWAEACRPPADASADDARAGDVADARV